MADEQIVQPKVQQPKADEPPLGETLKAMFAKPLLPDLPDFKMPLDVDVQQILGEQLRITGDTDITVQPLVSESENAGQTAASGNAGCRLAAGTAERPGTSDAVDNWPVNFTLNSTVNVDPIKGEKIKMTLDGGLREQLNMALNLSGPVQVQMDGNTRLADVGLPLNM